MKNILFVTSFSLILLSFFAGQKVGAQNGAEKEIPYIEVVGSADIEIEPDEIRVSVVIGNNVKKEKEKEPVVSLEQAESKLMDILRQVGISKDKVILKNASTGGYWPYYWYYDRYDEIGLRKEYEIIVTSNSQLDKLFSSLPGPKEGFLNVNISELKNKNIAEYRKQTKIEAMKAAKAKAEYLLESVGSSAGRLIQATELDEDDRGGWYRPAAAHSNVISQTSLNAGSSSGEDGTSIRKIKLRYRMKARFEIK